MKYGVNYQYLPKGHIRPLDDGTLLDIPSEDETLTLLPNVGDFVSLDQSIPAATMLGMVSFHGRVKSRVFRYVLANEKEQWCQINIVVEQTDDDWGALVKE